MPSIASFVVLLSSFFYLSCVDIEDTEPTRLETLTNYEQGHYTSLYTDSITIPSSKTAPKQRDKFNELYGFHLKKIVYVKKISDTKYTIVNHSPAALPNVQLQIHSDKEEKTFLIPQIPKFSRMTAEYVFKDSKPTTFTLQSNDSFFQSLKTIKVNWFLTFYNFNPDNTHKNWKDMQPMDIRNQIAVWINYAYVISHPLYYQNLKKYEGQLFDNHRKIVKNDEIYKRLVSDFKQLRLGVVKEKACCLGLASPSLLGLVASSFDKILNFKGGIILLGHEIMHTIRYDHTSNISHNGMKPNHQVNILYPTWEKLYKNSELPFMTNPIPKQLRH